MDPNQWRQIEEAFHAALEKPDQERERFLSEVFPEDPKLQRTVRDYVVTHAELGAFMDPPTREAFGVVAPSTSTLGRGAQVGSHVLEREIGSGGMGTVYLAQRSDGQFEQSVAIKVLRQGAGHGDLSERFRKERQALARLSHPHIARLYDGGTTAQGSPYLVMEYVDGRRIDEYCDFVRMTVPERIRLFIEVCSAVEYAHRNLIVHRDIKPSNILVDGLGVPKLLDFGIAKILNPEGLEEEKTQTRLMTPAYASPEQIRGAIVTTATDVYSLGVVLYKLLTGHRPHGQDRSPQELENAICEEDPEKPSTAIDRVGTGTGVGKQSITGTTRDTVSRARGVTPGGLRKRLSGDLDTIVLKALRKETTRRYQSVEQLSDDLRRYLEGRPITARSDTWLYRASRLVDRNKLVVSLAAVGLLAVLGSAAGSVRWALIASREAGLATLAAEAERKTAARLTEVNRYLRHFLTAADPRYLGRDALVRDFLVSAQESIDLEILDPEVELEIRSILAVTYYGLGLFDEAAEQQRLCVELASMHRPRDFEAICQATRNLGETLVRSGQFDEASVHFESAARLLEDHDLLEHRENLLLLSLRGELLSLQGEHDQAESMSREALVRANGELDPDGLEYAHVLLRLSNALFRAGRKLEESQRIGEEALRVLSNRFSRDHPEVLAARLDVAEVRFLRGERVAVRDEVLELLEVSRERLGPDHDSLVPTLSLVGFAFHRCGDPAAAEAAFREALELRRKKTVGGDRDLIRLVSNLGLALRAKGDVGGARDAYQEALDLHERLIGVPDEVSAQCRSNLGVAQLHLGQYEEAEDNLQGALEFQLEELGEDHPSTSETLNSLGFLSLRRGEEDEALTFLRRALLARRRGFHSTHPKIADSLFVVGRTEFRLGRPRQAVECLRETLDILGKIPDAPRDRPATAGSLLGACLTALGEFEEAEGFLLDALPVLEATRGKRHPLTLATRERTVDLYTAWGRPDKADDYRKR